MLVASIWSAWARACKVQAVAVPVHRKVDDFAGRHRPKHTIFGGLFALEQGCHVIHVPSVPEWHALRHARLAAVGPGSGKCRVPRTCRLRARALVHQLATTLLTLQLLSAHLMDLNVWLASSWHPDLGPQRIDRIFFLMQASEMVSETLSG